MIPKLGKVLLNAVLIWHLLPLRLHHLEISMHLLVLEHVILH